MDAALKSKTALGGRLFFRGVPVLCSSEAVKECFAQYGSIANFYFSRRSGGGFVQFHRCASLENVMLDAERLSLHGQMIEVKRASPFSSGEIDAGAPQQACVEPMTSLRALDVVVIRGHATCTGIGTAAMHAKAKTTVLVQWERHHRGSVEECPGAALQKRVRNSMEDERADNQMMQAAFEYARTGTPKCGLLHFGSDKLEQTAKMDTPLVDVDAVIAGMQENHTETLRCFSALSIYQPWIHAFEACAFIIIPPMMGSEWPEDLCLSPVSLHRSLKADPLRSMDGSGWTVGFQLTHGSAQLNASLLYSAVSACVLSQDSTMCKYSGKTFTLNIPLLELRVRPNSAVSNPQQRRS